MKIVKRLVCVVLLAFLGMWSSGAGYAQEQAAKPYSGMLVEVENYLRAGNFSAAMGQLDSIIASYPEAAEVYYAKALLFAQVRNFDQAISLTEKATALEPGNMLYLNYLVELYKGKGEPVSAIPVVDRAIELNPENAALYREKMLLFQAAEQSDQALQVYDEVVKHFGTSDTLDMMKAEVLMGMDKQDDALKLLRPWVEKQSAIRQIYSTAGYIYSERKELKNAIQVLERGLAYTHNNNLYLDLADVYAVNKDNDKAFLGLRKAFEAADVNYGDKHRVMFSLLNGSSTFSLEQLQALANLLVLKYPRIADSHVAKGDVMWRRGNLPEAVSLFLTAVGINRQHVDAWRMLMNVELALNEVDDAIDHGKEALAANPNNAMLLYFTGLSYMVKEDTSNARKYMEAALDNAGDENGYMQSLIYAGLGDLYHQLDLVDVSDVAYEEAIERDSTNAMAMNNYAYFLAERRDKLDLAEKLSRESNELEPSSATFQDTYAWVLFQRAKYKEALHWIEKAVKGSSPSAVLYEHYGDILFKSGNRKAAFKQWEKALTMSEGSDVDSEKLKLKLTSKDYVE